MALSTNYALRITHYSSPNQTYYLSRTFSMPVPVPVTMPKLGETVVDGTVARWHKQPGDRVEKLEPLLDISTDKIDTEVPAPAAGTLLEIVVKEGETVEAGAVLAYIEEDDGRQTTDDGSLTTLAASDEVAGDSGRRTTSLRTEDEGRTSVVGDPSSVVSGPSSSAVRPHCRAFISPVVARIAAEHNVDLEQVAGSGLHGRITKKDVLAYIGDRGKGTGKGEQLSVISDQLSVESEHPSIAQSPNRPISQSPNRPIVQSPIPSPQSPIPNPLSSMRRAIAEHMTRSVRNAPHVATIHEVDMTAVVRDREDHKDLFAERGIRLTFTPYFVAATAAALRALPQANSRFSEDGLILNRRVHLGVAVAVKDGLLVPVIRDADERNLAGLARAVNDLAERARQGKLQPDELTGGTFTITNHGTAGSLLATPIINDGQAGILGIGAIVKRPVVRSGGHPLLPSADDAIVIRPMCYLSFSFDHRVLDGAEADEFVGKIKAVLENWTNHSITSNE
jgi:2-oxoglutarate dehydrogenase E2 component (dihydrolipoamide succinyltransferase)